MLPLDSHLLTAVVKHIRFACQRWTLDSSLSNIPLQLLLVLVDAKKGELNSSIEGMRQILPRIHAHLHSKVFSRAMLHFLQILDEQEALREGAVAVLSVNYDWCRRFIAQPKRQRALNAVEQHISDLLTQGILPIERPPMWLANHAKELEQNLEMPESERKSELDNLIKGLLSIYVHNDREGAVMSISQVAISVGCRLSADFISTIWSFLLANRKLQDALKYYRRAEENDLLSEENGGHEIGVRARIIKLARTRGNTDLVQSTFEDMVESHQDPRVTTKANVLYTLAEAGWIKETTDTIDRFFPQVLTNIYEGTYPNDPFTALPAEEDPYYIVFTAMIQVLTLANQKVQAENWWNMFQKYHRPPQKHHFDNMIYLEAQFGNLEVCQDLVDQMLVRNVYPDGKTRVFLLALFIANDKHAIIRKMISSVTPKPSGNRSDPRPLFNTELCVRLIEHASKIGNYDAAAQVYQSLDTKTRVHPRVGAAGLRTLVFLGTPYDVIKYHWDRIFPNWEKIGTRYLDVLIQAACYSDKLRIARRLVELISTSKNKDANRPHAWSLLASAHLRRGELDKAREVFQEMSKHDVALEASDYRRIIEMLLLDTKLADDYIYDFTDSLIKDRPWTPHQDDPGGDLERLVMPVVINAAKLGDIEQLEKYARLLAAEPNGISIHVLSVMLSAYRHPDMLSKARSVWKQIVALARSTRPLSSSPSDLLCKPLSMYMDVLSVSGRHHEVFQLWKFLDKNGFGFDEQNWNHLGLALTRAGRPLQAFALCEKVLFPLQKSMRNRPDRTIRPISGTRRFRILPELESEPDQLLEGAFQEDLASDGAIRRRELFTKDRRLVKRKRTIDDRLPLDQRFDAFAKVLDTGADPTLTIPFFMSSWRPKDIGWGPNRLLLKYLCKAMFQMEKGIQPRPIYPQSALQDEEVRKEAEKATQISDQTYNSLPSTLEYIRKEYHITNLRVSEFTEEIIKEMKSLQKRKKRASRRTRFDADRE